MMCISCSLEIIPEDRELVGWGGRAGGGRKAEPGLEDPKVIRLPLLFVWALFLPDVGFVFFFFFYLLCTD